MFLKSEIPMRDFGTMRPPGNALLSADTAHCLNIKGFGDRPDIAAA